MKEFITIGKISKNCKSSIIYCGDYSSQETTECTYNIINNKISAFDSDFSYEPEEEIFRPNSKALNELSNNIKSYGMDLSTNSIYNACNLLDELDSDSQTLQNPRCTEQDALADLMIKIKISPPPLASSLQ